MPLPKVDTSTPGVQIKEIPLAGPPIQGVGTSTAGFVGAAPTSGTYKNVARFVTSADQFATDYMRNALQSTPLSRAVLGFFANGGTSCYVVDVGSTTPTDIIAGLKMLEVIDDIAIIATPGHYEDDVTKALVDQAESTRDRIALIDTPPKVDDITSLTTGLSRPKTASMYSAFYYPRIKVAKQLSGDDKDGEYVTPVGHIAGVYALVDATRGVHKQGFTPLRTVDHLT